MDMGRALKKADATGHTRPTVFVLWGTHFDEIFTVLLVTHLRQAGIRVKLIGVHGPWAKGEHGLGLHTDLTLDEALAAVEEAIGVVIPCTTPMFQGLGTDPRIQSFLDRLQEKRAFVVVGKLPKDREAE
ncbi:MAG: hypothetical protein KF832_11755 [Caldilineaceae bacterium]|nr:hypothetical protein [Caldilineaceae bacterium]